MHCVPPARPTVLTRKICLSSLRRRSTSLDRWEDSDSTRPLGGVSSHKMHYDQWSSYDCRKVAALKTTSRHSHQHVPCPHFCSGDRLGLRHLFVQQLQHPASYLERLIVKTYTDHGFTLQRVKQSFSVTLATAGSHSKRADDFEMAISPPRLRTIVRQRPCHSLKSPALWPDHRSATSAQPLAHSCQSLLQWNLLDHQ